MMYFSTVIGAYLFAMGVGSYRSRFIERALVARFVAIEIMVGFVGGSSAAALFLAFAYLEGFRLILYAQVLIVGTLVGLEIPLLLRILKDKVEFKDLVSQVLTFDYLGALGASLIFPLVLAPHLGLVRTCFMFGLMNTLVALWTTFVFRGELARHVTSLRAQAILIALLLFGGIVYGERLTTLAEESLYSDDIIFAKTTPYQRIVITRWRDDIRLFLNGHLQFSSNDEYRYHEALVHPGLQSVQAPRRVLVLGGGDGLAVREILRHPTVESVTLVDLDADMTKLFTDNPLLRALNHEALHSPKVHVVNADAFVWLNDSKEFFDFAVVDFPDPTNYALGKLYTSAFYKTLLSHLSDNGAAAIQATSPLFARRSYWCIETTLASVGFLTSPYHLYVPSFGEWGFILASRKPYAPAASYPKNLRFVDTDTVKAMFQFPPDMARVDADVNRLNNQILVQYYDSEWREAGQ
jgi:spermidine synthase